MAGRASKDRSVNEHELIRRSVEGDASAYRSLVEPYEDRLRTVARRLVGDAHRAEDVVQDAMLKAYARLGSFHGRSSFYTWIYRIMVNAASDLRQKEERRRAVSLDDGPVGRVLAVETPGPEARAIAAEHRAIVRREIEELSPKLKTILKLREIDGLTYEELAVTLGISKGTVESRLFRAREKLAARLRDVL
jgi:RNA polymerase sigma-70 factor (ECF subfamily)